MSRSFLSVLCVFHSIKKEKIYSPLSFPCTREWPWQILPEFQQTEVASRRISDPTLRCWCTSWRWSSSSPSWSPPGRWQQSTQRKWVRSNNALPGSNNRRPKRFNYSQLKKNQFLSCRSSTVCSSLIVNRQLTIKNKIILKIDLSSISFTVKI